MSKDFVFFILFLIYDDVKKRLIPFDKFVQTLATSVKNKRNEPLKDNGIIWVLLQCLSKIKIEN